MYGCLRCPYVQKPSCVVSCTHARKPKLPMRINSGFCANPCMHALPPPCPQQVLSSMLSSKDAAAARAAAAAPLPRPMVEGDYELFQGGGSCFLSQAWVSPYCPTARRAIPLPGQVQLCVGLRDFAYTVYTIDQCLSLRNPSSLIVRHSFV